MTRFFFSLILFPLLLDGHNLFGVSEDEPIPDLLTKKELLKANWEDEDLDENDVKDSWEDEEEPPKVCNSTVHSIKF